MVTSSSVQPRGWTSPGKATEVQPAPLPVAAVGRVAVGPLAGVLVEQALEPWVGGQAPVLLLAVDVGEVVAQPGQAFGVALLEPDHRSVELPLGPALAALDPGAPGQLLDRAQRQEAVEPGVAAVATGEGPAGPDAGRVDEEGAEEPVDVVGRSRGPGSGRAVVVRRDQPVDGRLDDGVLVRGEPARNAATLGA